MNELNTTGSVNAEGKEKKNNRNVFARQKQTNGVGKKKKNKCENHARQPRLPHWEGSTPGAHCAAYCTREYAFRALPCPMTG
jgi:hypothetical protein